MCHKGHPTRWTRPVGEGSFVTNRLHTLGPDGCVRQNHQRDRDPVAKYLFRLSLFPTLFKCERVSWRWSFSTGENWEGVKAFAQNGAGSAKNVVSRFPDCLYFFSCQKVSVDSGFFHYRSPHTIEQEEKGACLQEQGLWNRQNKATWEPRELFLLLAGDFC